MKAIPQMWAFFTKNWDIVLTMLISAVIAILSFFQTVEPQVISTAILSTLFLIACSLLVNRETNNRLLQTTDKVWERIQKPSIDEVIVPYKTWMEDIEKQLESATEVWILSRTCTRFWEDYQAQLQKIIDRKGSIRLMLVDPRNGALRMIAESIELARAHDLVGRFRRVTQDDTNRLAVLRGRVEDFVDYISAVSIQVGKGRLDFRTIEYLPAHTLVIINGASQHGVIFVELGTFNANGRNRPTFSLVKAKDSRLFSLYYDDYKIMWECARAFDGHQLPVPN